MSVPVFHLNEGAMGALYVDHRGMGNAFSEAEQTFLQAFANLVGVALVNARMYEQLKKKHNICNKRSKDGTSLAICLDKVMRCRRSTGLSNAPASSDVPVLVQVKQVRGRNWLRVPYTTIVHAKTSDFCHKIVPHFHQSCCRVSCLGTEKVRLQARMKITLGF